jgi:hypothetical protein
MKKNGNVRRYGSASTNVWSMGKSGSIRKQRANELVVRTNTQASAVLEGHIRSGIYSGPSAGGKNMKFVKAVSGTVIDRKPSFA